MLYDTATFHTRLDGDGHRMRRTWHQYYARGGWLRSALPTTNRYVRAPSPVLTDWNLFPERLAMHPGPEDPPVLLALEHRPGRMGRQRLRPRRPQSHAEGRAVTEPGLGSVRRGRRAVAPPYCVCLRVGSTRCVSTFWVF